MSMSYIFPIYIHIIYPHFSSLKTCELQIGRARPWKSSPSWQNMRPILADPGGSWQGKKRHLWENMTIGNSGKSMDGKFHDFHGNIIEANGDSR